MKIKNIGPGTSLESLSSVLLQDALSEIPFDRNPNFPELK